MLILRSLTAPSLLPRLSLTARVTSSVVSPPLSPSRFSTARSVLSPYLSHNRELQLMTGEPLISSRRSLSSVASSSTLRDPSSAPRSAYHSLYRHFPLARPPRCAARDELRSGRGRIAKSARELSRVSGSSQERSRRCAVVMRASWGVSELFGRREGVVVRDGPSGETASGNYTLPPLSSARCADPCSPIPLTAPLPRVPQQAPLG
jgi:hypothetical protein